MPPTRPAEPWAVAVWATAIAVLVDSAQTPRARVASLALVVLVAVRVVQVARVVRAVKVVRVVRVKVVRRVRAKVVRAPMEAAKGVRAHPVVKAAKAAPVIKVALEVRAPAVLAVVALVVKAMDALLGEA